MDRYPRSGSIVQGRSGLQTYMAQVYGWMTVGLLLTRLSRGLRPTPLR
ncbi:integral membrane protein [Klebsiella michiganensis]|uniref:Integral membrane protein n=1 Tax=Klebsiella michiganensis TaxID=1134687 RepID=A0A7H4N3F7_9ENTR|nr:integral membrane protein [Klebsiella michiganensis]